MYHTVCTIVILSISSLCILVNVVSSVDDGNSDGCDGGRRSGSQWRMISVPSLPETSISLAITIYSLLSIRSALAQVMNRDSRLNLNDCSTSSFLLFQTSTRHPLARESGINSHRKHRELAASPRTMSCRVSTI